MLQGDGLLRSYVCIQVLISSRNSVRLDCGLRYFSVLYIQRYRITNKFLVRSGFRGCEVCFAQIVLDKDDLLC